MLSCVCATPSLTETFNIDGNQFKIANRRSPKEMKDRRGQGTGDRGQGTGDRGQGRYTYPFTTKFQDDVNIVSIIEETVETNNVPVIQGLMNRDLLRHFLSLIAFRH
jgi:hypothetical protein